MAYDRKDAFYKRAKREGYRSRAAFKLEEIQQRTHVLTRGQRVVDLGAWPGGWLQVIAEHVGAKGRIVGVDLVTIDPLPNRTIEILRADVGDPALPERILGLLEGRADLVVSDLAPKLTGIAPRDEAAAAELAEHTIRVATACLKAGGATVLKTFGGSTAEETRALLAQSHRKIRRIGLEATRKGSSELYLVATGFRGGLAAKPVD